MLLPSQSNSTDSRLSARSNEPTLHVRFNGHSCDVPVSDLDIGELSSETEIKHALARYLGVGVDRFRDYRVDRHPNGNLTFRPQAVFG